MAKTQLERLAVIEQILEDAFKEGGAIPEMRKDIKAIRTDFEEHKEDYQSLKNKGIGAIGAISMIFTGVGIIVSLVWDKVTGAIFG